MSEKMKKSKDKTHRASYLMASATLIATLTTGGNAGADVNANANVNNVPLYKPSSRSPEPVDISSNVYGASSLAPTAIAIGEVAPEFKLPVSGGGLYESTATTTNNPTAIIFYRGHW